LPTTQHNLPDPLGIRAATRMVLQRARWVQLDPAGIESILSVLPSPLPDLPDWDHSLHWRGTPEQTANYVLLLDALNFCFWGEPRWRIRYRDQLYDGYWALAAALRRALERGQPLYDAGYLAQLTDDQIADLFAGEGTIPLLTCRIEHVREVARGLRTACDGQFAHLVRRADGSAATLVRLVTEVLPLRFATSRRTTVSSCRSTNVRNSSAPTSPVPFTVANSVPSTTSMHSPRSPITSCRRYSASTVRSVTRKPWHAASTHARRSRPVLPRKSRSGRRPSVRSTNSSLACTPVANQRPPGRSTGPSGNSASRCRPMHRRTTVPGHAFTDAVSRTGLLRGNRSAVRNAPRPRDRPTPRR